MKHLQIAVKTINNLIVDINLNEKEKIALKAVKAGIEDGLQTDEITEYVSEQLACSLNTAKGYIGKLVQKGIIIKERYKDYSIGWITQFSLNKNL